jgi:hypothetical protein
MLTRKLLKQEFLLAKVKSSLRKCYGHHHDMVDHYGISVSQWQPICSTYCKHFTVFYSFTTYYQVCNYITMTCITSGSGSTDPSIAPEFIPVFIWTPVTWPLALYICFVNHCFSFCTFSFRHCDICSLIYGIWLHLWSLQTLLSKVIELATISSANIWNFQD